MANILFINTHYPPDFQYGGVIESGSTLFKHLRRLSPSIKISVVSRTPARVYETLIQGEEGYCYQSIFLHRAGFSLEAFPGLFRDVVNADVVLLNGLFSIHNTLAFLYIILFRKKFILALRGGFEPWALKQKSWKKWPYVFFLSLFIKKAAYVHVTSSEEQNSAKRLGFPPERIINISNGIDVNVFNIAPDKIISRDRNEIQFGSRFVFLFLSRTDKEKGLDILLAAYRKLCLVLPVKKHVLCIVGPDHQGYLKGMNLDYAKENIDRIEGVYGEDKLALLRRADTLVLPSYSENFGNVVAEALACETPVITTTGTPWAEIEKVGCGLYIKPEAEALYQAMKAMYSKPEAERREMGRRGREYVLKNFNWEDKARELFGYLQKLAPACK